jgi:hypothetical protein
VSFSGGVSGGKGNVTVRFNGTDECVVELVKDLRYPSWRFSLSILLGVVSMLLGLQAHFGWGRLDLAHAPSIPIDNPGVRCEFVDEKKSVKEMEDRYRSIDGY